MISVNILNQQHSLTTANHLDMESVDALIDGINAYSGGVLLVSHDARLITATDCELWVCAGDSTVRRHEHGFEHYRRNLLREIALEERRAAAAAAERSRVRAAARSDRVAQLSSSRRQSQRAAGAGAQAAAAVQAVEQQEQAQREAAARAAETVAAVFGKKRAKGKKLSLV